MPDRHANEIAAGVRRRALVVNLKADLNFSPLGDRAVLLQVSEQPDPSSIALLRALADYLAQLSLPGVLDLVPALCTLGIHYDPERWRDTSGGRIPYELLVEHIQAVLPDLASLDVTEGQIHEIPVCYETAYGEDLPAVASACGLTPQQVIEIHSTAVYAVYMIGFAPGFAYLGPLDQRLALPRRQTPRARVPVGSVAVANQYTGIYPADLPGGWHVIGRTPLRLFDPSRDQPSLLTAGDRVRFTPVGAASFRRMLGTAQ